MTVHPLWLIFWLWVVPLAFTFGTCWLEDRAAIKRGETPPSSYTY